MSEKGGNESEDEKVVRETLEDDIDRDKRNVMLNALKMQLIIFTMKDEK